MRIIKFRVWSPEEKQFVENDLDLIMELNEAISEYQERGLVFSQFTGLLDKQGKEIYGGDIVKTNSVKRAEPLDVKFLDGAFCVGKKNIGFNNFGDWVTIRDGMAQAKLRDMELEIEVIGNIYENQKK